MNNKKEAWLWWGMVILGIFALAMCINSGIGLVAQGNYVAGNEGKGLKVYVTENPFEVGKWTTFYMEILDYGIVNLTIYDLSGDRVRELVKEERADSFGTYRVGWDGRNDLGDYVNSGIYIYRLIVMYNGGLLEYKVGAIGVIKGGEK